MGHDRPHDPAPRTGGTPTRLITQALSSVSGRVPLSNLYERGRSLGIGVQVSAQSWQGRPGAEDQDMPCPMQACELPGHDLQRPPGREQPAGDVGEDLLHDGVVAVLPLGLHQFGRRVGEDRVVTPDGEQLVLPRGSFLFRSRTRRTINRAVAAWPFFDANAVYWVSATSASDIQQSSWSSQTACGYRIGVQFSSPIAAMAARMLLFTGTVTKNRAPWPRTAPMTPALQEAESSRTMIVPGAAGAQPGPRGRAPWPASTCPRPGTANRNG